MENDEKNNEIGYGKPPKEFYFKPGVSGNPAGYPTGKPNRGTLARKFLKDPIHYKDPATGEYVKGTIEEAMVLAMMAAATNGDVNAYKEIMDSVYGKITDKQEITLPIKTVIRIGGKRPKSTDATQPADSADE